MRNSEPPSSNRAGPWRGKHGECGMRQKEADKLKAQGSKQMKLEANFDRIGSKDNALNINKRIDIFRDLRQRRRN